MIKVLIADDQELIRQSLSIILGLKEEISVVGGVGDGTEVLEFKYQILNIFFYSFHVSLHLIASYHIRSQNPYFMRLCATL